MRSNEFRKFLVATTGAATICLLLLCSAGLSFGASLESTDDTKETTAVLKTSPILKRAELIQTSPAIGSMELLNQETAARLVQDVVVAPFWELADQSKGLRVLQHDEMLVEGVVIEPAFAPLGGPTRRMVAQNQSWLFMIDELPGAHFAHPVKLVLVDANTGERQEMETDWWPKVNEVQLFDTEADRTDPKLTTFYIKPTAEVKLSTSSGVLGQLGSIKPLINCDVWAILVCGYNDLPDTFDDDTNGMYSVLRNLGVPDDHIFYVSPHAGHAGVDRPTSRSNVQWAINEVAARSDIKDKVLFLYSSHGNVNFVSCVPDIPDGGSITASEMDTWLDAISCKEMAIIIEACHSGSFIGKYKDGTYIAGENELTGDGETNRVVFTSASTDTSSWPDIDDGSDPNPADTGSESIYGYMMAFSIASADANGDGRISFGEAHQYAWDNDVTRILGWNVPQLIESGLNKANVYHQCLQYECYSNLPSPMLTLIGTEDYTASGGEYTRYKLSVTNWNAYPAELFESAPDLPPCGLNTESSRTWVDIYDASGKRLYGFCALSSPSDLQNLWFAVKKGEKPPKSVYVVLKDRRCDEEYKSNQVTTEQKYECYSNLPSPMLTLTGTEDYTASGGEYTRYKLSVTNWNAYPAELFESAPDLPPCGLNTESSRTWVDIYNASGKRLYGFCALSSPSDLQNLWFAVKKGEKPPKSVYVVLKDRRCDEEYKSNQVTTEQKILAIAPANMNVVQIKEPMSVVGKVLA